jgi:ribosomal protein L19E
MRKTRKKAAVAQTICGVVISTATAPGKKNLRERKNFAKLNLSNAAVHGQPKEKGVKLARKPGKEMLSNTITSMVMTITIGGINL